MPKRSAALSLSRRLSRQWQAAANRVLRATAGAIKGASTRTAKRAATGAAIATAKPTAKDTRSRLAKRASPAPPPTAGPGDWIAGLTMGRGGMRRYRLFRPAGIGADERVPLVVMLHGCGQDATAFAHSTRMNRVAARERFLVLYPEQSRLANPQRCWNWFETESGRAQAEAAQILAAVDQVGLLYPVDRDRVAIAGLSAGAGMAAWLATAHPTHFRAVAMHSGVAPGLASSASAALRAMRGGGRPPRVAPRDADAPWPPLLVIQGTQDRVVASANASEAARQWAAAAGATATAPRELRRGRRHPMTVVDFKRRGHVAATLVEIHGLAHAWSGGAARQPFSDPAGPDATAMIWRFFAKRLR
jgi:poly(hydroxyalkanoate) depolymerase family esterase